MAASELAYRRENLKEMLRQSKKEFARWKSTKNEVFLQQACEKLFNVLEMRVEVRSGLDIRTHREFSEEYRKLNKAQARRIIPLANYLHRFFYEGKALEGDYSAIEETYREVLKVVN